MSSRNGPLIVYHRPGDPGAAAGLLEELKRLVAEALGQEPILMEIHEALEARRGGEAFLLLPTRGGHWRSLVDAGYEAVTPPTWLTATILAGEARARGARGLLLVALRGHRLVELQEEDIEAVEAILRGVHGLEAGHVLLESLSREPPEPPRGWLAAPLAMLPGRLASAACRAAPGRCLGPILSHGLRELAAWIAGAWLEKGRRGNTAPEG